MAQNASVYSLIPVTVKETGKTLQAIIPEFVQGLESSANAFDRAAEGLLDLATVEAPATRDGMLQYINVLRTMMTGNLCWS